jgi:hypothetical protein
MIDVPDIPAHGFKSAIAPGEPSSRSATFLSTLRLGATPNFPKSLAIHCLAVCLPVSRNVIKKSREGTISDVAPSRYFKIDFSALSAASGHPTGPSV